MKVIITEYHPWDTDFRIGNHHYARIFLDQGWDVLWISHPVSGLHSLKPSNKERVGRAKCGPVRHPDGPIELVPYTNLPFLKQPLLSSDWVLKNTHKFCNPPLNKSLADAGGFDNPDLVWMTDTVMHGLVDTANWKALAVRIADDNTQFKNMPVSLKHVEHDLAERADIIFTTSSPLEDRLKGEFGEKVSLLRNGVNYEHFTGEFDIPEEYAGLEGPIAIYVGAIEEWFEPDWIEKLARERGDINIVLIGGIGIETFQFDNLPNVHFLGPKPYEEIPAFLAHADLGIIPFKRTTLVESVSPLKLFEFFASGLPVVSAAWMELERLESPALLVNDAEEFVVGVSRVMDEKWKLGLQNNYRYYAQENSWQARFDFAMSELDKYLAK